jgi:outer membrane receptor for ferrienterochelin and colicins
MKLFKSLLACLFIITSFTIYSQNRPENKKIKISGVVIEKNSKQLLEYATITLINTKNPKVVFGTITNPKGEFLVEANAGMYDVKIEFISYKISELKSKLLTEDTNLGTIELSEDATQLQAVEIRSEKTTVEIKLDKKVYNLGKDLMVKGGTVSDVLDNIPSVTVDVEGVVSLRGNENVRILIDGKPTNANNIGEALRLIPADAVDKVEVITNPSARYDAEGGGGILNIVLKKGKTNGLNGTFIATAGYPDNQSVSGTINYKSDNFNLFTTQGYAFRANPGNFLLNTDYLNPTYNAPLYIGETRKLERQNKSYNGTFGIELFINKSTTLTNTLNFRKSTGDNQDFLTNNKQFSNATFNSIQKRNNQEDNKTRNVDFSANLLKRFKKDGHKLTIDSQFSVNNEATISEIIDNQTGIDNTKNIQEQSRSLVQADYVLPLPKGSQFELGYRGDFSKQNTDVEVLNNLVSNDFFTGNLKYNENVNALYTQYGFKISKFSYLLGLRWEDSDIVTDRASSNFYSNKKYNNFFPSAFVTYEISDKSSVSLSYSRRIQRPRGRQINPFNTYSSNNNIFLGNLDLNPAMTDAIDFGFLKRWEKLTLSTSMYVNKSTDVFQFIRRSSGLINNGIPVIVAQPINLEKEYRAGFEFTLNYSPYKWWKINSNFNFFKIQTVGIYEYTDNQNKLISTDFANSNSTWTSRFSSKITLPAKIDWQTNFNYEGPRISAQGRILGNYGLNLAFSKDILKDKATVAFNVSDVFNTKRRIMRNEITDVVRSYGDMQFRQRQFTLSFTYRFNKKKSEEKPVRRQEEGGDYQG